MITNLIVTAFLAGLDAITSLLPRFTLYNGDTSGFTVGTAVGHFNTIFPIKLALSVALFAVGVRLLFQFFDLAVWIYHQFWGAS